MQKTLLRIAAVVLLYFVFGLESSSAQTPILSRIDPASAVQGQTIQIALRGKNYVVGQTVVTMSPPAGVTIGNLAVTNTAQMTASFTIAPDAVPGERTVTLTTPNGVSASLSFRIKPATAAPTITSITPSGGPPGTTPTVTLTGTNFVNGATGITVSGFGLSVSAFNVNSSAEITSTFSVMPNATIGPRDINVVTPGGTSNALPFTVFGPPTLTGITPGSGPTGNGAQGTQVVVNISGTNFVSGQTTVEVNGTGVSRTGPVNVQSPTSIQTAFSIAADAAQISHSITVTTPGGSITGLSFAVTAPINNLTFLDPSAVSTVSEVIVNEGNSTQANVRVVDGNGVTKSGVAVTYSSINPAVAAVNPATGAVQGVSAGFATLTASAGGVVTTTTITVVQVSSAGSETDVTGVVQDTADRLYLASQQSDSILLAQNLGQAPQVYAGNGSPGIVNGPRLQSQFNNPAFIAIDQSDGTLYVSDSANNAIRKIQAGTGGQVQTLATGFNNPQGVALDNRGNLWVADSGSHTIRKINLSTLAITTVAGLAGQSGNTDNPARFNAPVGLVLEKETPAQELDRFRLGLPPPPVRVLVADTVNGLIRRVYETGVVETIGDTSFSIKSDSDDKAVFASLLQFSSPTGIATDSQGNVFISEPGSSRVRTILRSGAIVDAVQPNTFSTPKGLTGGKSGKIVVATASGSTGQIRFGAPQITNVTPAFAPATGGTPMTIQGNNFAPDTIVILGGVVPSNLVIHDTQTITFNAPAAPSGLTTLTVQNRGGLAQSPYLLQPTPLSALPVGYITTVAGGTTYAGDGGLASASTVYGPAGIAADSSGNVFIADSYNHRIRKINIATSVITTVAGNGQESFSGDNGPAPAAGMSFPTAVVVDSSGNLFISDGGNARIRRVDAATGIITTVAGNGQEGFSGDGGPATAASIAPTDLAFDAAGNMFISEPNNRRTRKVTKSTGIITTVAGNGTTTYPGDNGQATAAGITPYVVTLDAAGDLYIGDFQYGAIRKVNMQTGVMTTIAGAASGGCSPDGGLAAGSALGFPSGLAFDVEGNLLISDYVCSRIQKVNRVTGLISTIVGNGTVGYGGDNGPALAATLKRPRGIALDAAANLYIADYGGNRLRRVSGPTGIITTVAGNGEGRFSGDGAPAAAATLNFPNDVASVSSGDFFVADVFNNRVRNVNAATGVITTAAGSDTEGGFSGDGGPAVAALLKYTLSVATDSSGNLYFVDAGNCRIRRVVAATGIIATVAGNGQDGSSGDNGPATNAKLSCYYVSIAVDAVGNIIIADRDKHLIRKVTASTGIITRIAGDGQARYFGDGGPALLASLSSPIAVALDSVGNIFISDSGNHRIRKISAETGIITTAAGDGQALYLGDNGSALSASLASPWKINLDSANNMFLLDLYGPGYAVRKITASTGVISTIAANTPLGFSGDNGPAATALFYFPVGISTDFAGNLYIADQRNQRIRAIRSAGGGSSAPNAPTPVTIAIVSGNTQSAMATASLGAPLKVRVKNLAGAGIPNITVNWEILKGAGSVSASQTTTDANGDTQVNATLGLYSGQQVFRASVSPLIAVDFTATATTPPAILSDQFNGFASTGINSGVTFTSTTAVISSYGAGIEYSASLFPAEGIMEMVVRLNGVSPGGTLLDSAGADQRSQGDIFWYVSDSGIMSFALAPTAGLNPFDQFQLTSTHSIKDGNFHAVAICYGSGGLKLFIDGNLEATNSFTGSRNTSRPVALGDFTDRFESDAVNQFSFIGEVDVIRTSNTCSPALAP